MARRMFLVRNAPEDFSTDELCQAAREHRTGDTEVVAQLAEALAPAVAASLRDGIAAKKRLPRALIIAVRDVPPSSPPPEDGSTAAVRSERVANRPPCRPHARVPAIHQTR